MVLDAVMLVALCWNANKKEALLIIGGGAIGNFINWIDLEKKANCLYRVVDSNCAEYQKWIITFNEDVDYLTTEELYNFYNFITQQDILTLEQKISLYNMWKQHFQMKKEFEYYIKNIDPYYFEGSIETVVSNIHRLKEEHFEYKDLIIKPYYIEDKLEFDLYGTRLETDEEYIRRLEFEKSMEEHKKRRLKKIEQEERELYETLKKKYETN